MAHLSTCRDANPGRMLPELHEGTTCRKPLIEKNTEKRCRQATSPPKMLVQGKPGNKNHFFNRKTMETTPVCMGTMIKKRHQSYWENHEKKQNLRETPWEKPWVSQGFCHLGQETLSFLSGASTRVSSCDSASAFQIFEQLGDVPGGWWFSPRNLREHLIGYDYYWLVVWNIFYFPIYWE